MIQSFLIKLLTNRKISEEQHMRILSLIFTISFLHGCASFTNEKGEKFPFSIQQSTLSKPAPTVIVSHGGYCLTDYDRAWANKLNNWGFNAIIIDHCSARGIGPHTGIDPPLLKIVDRVSDYAVIAKWLQNQNFHNGKIALLGESRGGEGVMRASDIRFNRSYGGDEALKLISSYIAYYPPCTSPPKESRGPVLIHHGDKDNLAVFSTCEYDSWTNKNVRLNVYHDVSHAFDQPGSVIYGSNQYLGSFIARKYDFEADIKSQEITKKFLEETLR